MLSSVAHSSRVKPWTYSDLPVCVWGGGANKGTWMGGGTQTCCADHNVSGGGAEHERATHSPDVLLHASSQDDCAHSHTNTNR